MKKKRKKNRKRKLRRGHWRAKAEMGVVRQLFRAGTLGAEAT